MIMIILVAVVVLVVRCVQAAVCTMMTYHLAAVYPVHPWSGAAAAVSASFAVHFGGPVLVQYTFRHTPAH